MKRKGKVANDTDILDEQEQEEVLSTIRQDVERQIANARKYVHWTLLLLCVMMMTCLIYSARFPLEMEHQAHFRGKVPHWCFQIYYFGSGLCLFCTGLVAKLGHRSTPTSIKIVSVLLAVGTSIFWVVVFALHEVTVPQLYWLPLINPGSILLALYIDRDAEYLRKDVDRLENSRYQHKTI